MEPFVDPAQQSRRLELFAGDSVKEIPFAPQTIEPCAWHGRAELERNEADNADRFAGLAHCDVRIFACSNRDETGRRNPADQALARVLQRFGARRCDRVGGAGAV